VEGVVEIESQWTARRREREGITLPHQAELARGTPFMAEGQRFRVGHAPPYLRILAEAPDESE
jgi:hypothetical protein